MFVLTRDGKTPVDVTVEAHGDVSIKVQDLEDARREIIALSGIPSAYLGYADAIDLREQLVHANIAFATEIADHQERDIKSLNELVDIISIVKGNDIKPSEYIKISLIPPIVLILQLIETTLSSVGNISGIFQNMGISHVDPYFFLQQYVPHIDWDAFRSSIDKKKTEDSTREDLNGDGGGSGGNNTPGTPGGLY
jgi:hypothetical protein